MYKIVFISHGFCCQSEQGRVVGRCAVVIALLPFALSLLPIIDSIQVIPVDSTLFAAVKNLIQVRSFQGAGFIVKMSAQNELACARPSVDLLPSLTVWKSLTAPQQFGMNTAFFLIFLSGACLNPSKYEDFDVETGSGGKLCPTWHIDSNGVMRYVCCMRLFWYT